MVARLETVDAEFAKEIGAMPFHDAQKAVRKFMKTMRAGLPVHLVALLPDMDNLDPMKVSRFGRFTG